MSVWDLSVLSGRGKVYFPFICLYLSSNLSSESGVYINMRLIYLAKPSLEKVRDFLYVLAILSVCSFIFQGEIFFTQVVGILLSSDMDEKFNRKRHFLYRFVHG